MENIFLKLVNMSITAGWLIFAVILLRFLLRKAPKWILGFLWALVAVRLICPISLESIFSMVPSSETIRQETIVSADPPSIDSGIVFVDNVVNRIMTDTFTPAPEASVNPLQIWLFVVSVVWVVGVFALLVYALVSYLRLRYRVRMAVRLRDSIYVSEFADTPFILGVVRPRIYLPSGMEETMREPVIAHERAHLKRGDHFWKPFAYVLLAVYWFHPLCWVAYSLLCKDIELACDEKVIKDYDSHQKKAYSEALLACSVNRRTIAACPLAFGEVGVKERIKSVLHYKKPAFWIIVAAVVACVVVAVCFLTNPVEDAVDPTDSVTDLQGNHTQTADEVQEPAEAREVKYQMDAEAMAKLADSMSEEPELASELEGIFAYDRSEWFEAYNGEKLQRIPSETSENRGPSEREDIIFYHSEEGETPEEVVVKMIDAMISPLMEPADGRPYTILEYEIAEEQPMVKLGDGVWMLRIIDGYYRYEGMDLVSMEQYVNGESFLLQENGMMPFLRQGSEGVFLYLLLQEGDVYRLQRYGTMTTIFYSREQ